MLKFDFTIIVQFEKTRTQNCNNRKSFQNNFSCFNEHTFLQASIQKFFTYLVLSKNISLRKNIKLSNSAQTKLWEECFYCYNFVRHCKLPLSFAQHLLAADEIEGVGRYWVGLSLITIFSTIKCQKSVILSRLTSNSVWRLFTPPTNHAGKSGACLSGEHINEKCFFISQNFPLIAKLFPSKNFSLYARRHHKPSNGQVNIGAEVPSRRLVSNLKAALL